MTACCGGEHALTLIESIIIAMLAIDGILSAALLLQNEISLKRMEEQMKNENRKKKEWD